jgi:hypothetical protein
MKPNISTYSVLFFIGLILAYYASSDSKSHRSYGQQWLSLDKTTFKQLTYEEEGGKSVNIEPQGDKLFWVTFQAKADSETQQFRADDTMDQLLEDWTRLGVVKALGSSENLKLEDFALGTDAKLLILEFADQKYVFEVGKRSFQSPNVFMLDKKKNEVILVKQSLLNPLQKPRADLFERNIHDLELDTIDRIEVSNDDKQITLVPHEMKPGERKWVRAEDKEDEAADNWLGRILDLRARNYKPLHETQSTDQQPLKLRIEFYRGEDIVEKFTIREVLSATDGGDIAYYLKSRHTGGYVELYRNRIDTLLQDFSGVL